jgi:hypothetical protein
MISLRGGQFSTQPSHGSIQDHSNVALAQTHEATNIPMGQSRSKLESDDVSLSLRCATADSNLARISL